jgi:hypothetical protein
MAGMAASCDARARAPGRGRTGEGGDAQAQGRAAQQGHAGLGMEEHGVLAAHACKQERNGRGPRRRWRLCRNARRITQGRKMRD